MKMTRFFVLMAACFLSTVFYTELIQATPIAVQKPYHFRDHRSNNTVNVTVGDFLTIGAVSVVPNEANGTSGLAQQGTVSVPLFSFPFSVAPNLFARSVFYNSGLTGEWTLTFTNGPDTQVVPTPTVGAIEKMPFPVNVAMAVPGLTPTFTWTMPGGTMVDGVRIQIWDLSKSISIRSVADVILTENFPGDPGNYTIPTGSPLQTGKVYAIEISPTQTRGVPLADNSTILNRSRAFYNFSLLPASAPPNVLLPIVTPGHRPTFSFRAAIVRGQPINIDPTLAVGYDYAIGVGDPNFASVTLPTGIGDNQYELYLFDGSEYVFEAALSGGVEYPFVSGGVERFRILGIETSALLDPEDGTAFITGLKFTGDGEFTGTMTAITKDLVYLPLTIK